MKKSFPLIICLVFCVILNAQKHDYHWVLGYGSTPVTTTNGGTNIDFNLEPPDTSYVFRDMDIRFNGTSVSDEEGSLLFYTNGCYIAGADDLPIQNGDGLNPGIVADNYCENGYIAVQGSLILKKPESISEYYLFHEGLDIDNWLGGHAARLYYTIVDMSLDDGHGAVTLKNELLLEDTLCTGQFTAAKHANGRDWWLIMPESSSDKYYKFLFGPGGVDGPFEQEIGKIMDFRDWSGQAVFSPDGSNYIRFDTHNELSIFDFDRCTGTLANPIHISFDFGSNIDAGGVAVSPNSRFLYVSAVAEVYQFDLWATDIANSKAVVAVYDGYASPFSSVFYLALLAADGKIYINCPGSENVLHVIEKPNLPGLACDLRQHSFQLPTYNGSTIPNFPNYRLGPVDGSDCDTLGINNVPVAAFNYYTDSLDPLTVHFWDYSSYEPTDWAWTFGDSDTGSGQTPAHHFTTPGVYEVCLTASNDYGEDSICKLLNLSVTGIADLNTDEPEIELYPNPVANKLRIEGLETGQEYTILVYDIMGRLIQKQETETSERLVFINTGEFLPGTYIVGILKDGKPVFSEKFIVLR